VGRIAYVDGRYLPIDTPAICIEDRGYQFADAIYEVWAVRDGQLIDSDGHYRRMARSLAELKIERPMSDAALGVILRQIVRRNRLSAGLVYLQISRGVALRDHPFPADVRPVVVVTGRPVSLANAQRRGAHGVAVSIQPDIRWGRCDIKTVGLLPNVLAKQAALDAGANEVWFERPGGIISEGGSTNAWIVDATGVLRTAPETDNILRGVTRATVLRLAALAGVETEERAFTREELAHAKEAFMTSANAFVTPVVKADGKAIGDGTPGPVTRALRDAYRAATAAAAG
jgi:D-alanine transaminase